MPKLWTPRLIGVVRCAVTDARDEAWSDVESEIHLLPEWADGLDGLEQFSHAVVLFFMHQASFDAACHLRRAPRDREDMPVVGIFAQRARHRPNPIGTTAVAIVGVEHGVLRVRGLDAIDGTPVIDIKPFVPAFDSPAASAVPEWMECLMQGYF